MKKIVIVIVTLTWSLVTFSQGKYGATSEDSVTCIESLIYKDYLKNNADPKLALELWRTAYRVCPKSQKSLYINGVKMYKSLVKKTKDPELKKAYLDTMFSIYDQRIEMFGQKGLVLGLKGQSMLSTKQDKEKTFAVLNEALQLTGDKTQSGTLVATMFAIINLEKESKKTKEEVVQMYEQVTAICAANKSSKRAAKYAKAEEKIQGVTAPYLDCSVLVPLAEKNYEANKENIDWLRRMVNLLKRKKCYESPVFAQVAESFFQLEPSAEGAEGMGKLFLGKKDFTKAIDFFKKALEMAESDEDKATYNFSIAQTHSYKKEFSQARTYALKAVGLKSDWGAPYLLIGDCYSQSGKSCDDGELGKYGVYWAAVDKYKKAKAVDSSIADEANKKIASISSRYPPTKDVFFYSKKSGDTYTVGCWINETTTVRTK